MSNYRDWEDLASRLDGIYTVDDFETTAYRLVAEQVIYQSDRTSRVAYAILDLYERDFVKVLAPFGVALSINRNLRYVTALPRHAKAGTATIAQTLFCLVLRGLYDEGVRAGGLTEEGEILCDYIELQEKFHLMTGRDLPTRGELDTLLRAAKRWGIARRLEEHESGYFAPTPDVTNGGIAIRPAIVDVLGETALIQLAQWGASKDATLADGIAEVDQSEPIDNNPEMNDEAA